MDDMLQRLSQLVMVAKCKCPLQRSKSMTHFECLHIDNWIVDELMIALDLIHQSYTFKSPSESVNYTESMDSLWLS